MVHFLKDVMLSLAERHVLNHSSTNVLLAVAQLRNLRKEVKMRGG